MPKLTRRLRITIGILVGVPALLVGLLLWRLPYAADSLCGVDQDGVHVGVATTDADPRCFLGVSNLNDYPVSVSIRARLANKTEEEVHVNLSGKFGFISDGKTIYPHKPTDSFYEIISIDVHKR